MATKTWMTAAGVVGAVVIGGSALVAVATTGPSETVATSGATGASATASPEATTPSNSPTQSQDDPVGTSGSDQPAVTSAEAVEIARAELGMGADALALDEIDLKFEDGRQIWDVEFVGDHEVEVDSTTGDVVKVEVGDGRDDRGDDDDDHGDDDSGDDDSGHDDDSGRGRGSDDGPNHD